MDDLESGMSEELAVVLDHGKVVDGQNNQRLKDFFKKLLQTDAQIKKLKQTININTYQIDNIKAGRYKRSVKKTKNKYHIKHKFDKNKFKTHIKKGTSKVNDKVDHKRSALIDSNSGATGYVVESEEVVIRYDTDKKRNFPKCSHEQEPQTHEKDLKNPFYKHSQRIDEMLDKYKTYNNFGLVTVITDEHLETTNSQSDSNSDESILESMTKAKYIKPKIKDKSNEHDNSLKKYDNTNEHDNRENSAKSHKGDLVSDYEIRIGENADYRKFDENSNGPVYKHPHYFTTEKTITVDDVTESDRVDIPSDLNYNNVEKFKTPPSVDELDLSVSNLINPIDRTLFKQKSPRNLLHTGQRKLLQMDEEDDEHEELGYEDLNEVLADDKEGHDDADRHAEKKKRDNEEESDVPEEFDQNKNYPRNVYNQNWKGPMPLDPNELTAMIKQAALQNLNIRAPVLTKDAKRKRNIDEKDISDVQYVEDYTDNKYKNIIKVAQAYSDYGVYNKKEHDNEFDKKLKPSQAKLNKLFSKRKLFGKSRKGSTEKENFFGFAVKSGKSDNNKDFVDSLKKHVKFCGKPHVTHSTTLLSTMNLMGYDLDSILKPTYRLLETSSDIPSSTTVSTHSFILTFKKGSTPFKSNDVTSEEKLKPKYMTHEDTDIINDAKITLNKNKALNLRNMTNGKVEKLGETHVLNLNAFNERLKQTKPLKLAKSNITNKYACNGFYVKKCLRALKSIDMVDKAINDTINTASALKLTENNITNESENGLRNSNTFEDAINKTGRNTTNITKNNSDNAPDGMISFISIMSDWFHSLSSLSGENIMKAEENKGSKGSNDSVRTVPKSKNKILEENITKDFLNPAYDVEMVDNIGHRSRVLLSLDEKTAVKDISGMEKTKASIDSDIDDIVSVTLVLANNDTTKLESKSSSINAEIQAAENKTVGKRSLGDDPVFWNDLYDNSEYGVQVDYTDNVRDPTVKKTRNILHKSKNWLQGKISNATHRLRGKWSKSTTTQKKTLLKKASQTTEKPLVNKYNDTFGSSEVDLKRYARDISRNERRNTKKSFAALTAHMKKVCQEAAKAIENTKTVEVRDSSKENTAATSLMQQLVRMMTDLVDIQVQQKTCAKLPSDLHNFLQWLIAPSDDNVHIGDWPQVGIDYEDSDRFAKYTEDNLDFSTPVTEYSQLNEKNECLGTIRAVQDLIQEYEGMADEDKSKIVGVREYLENQLLFLNNKLQMP